ncbi:MAG: GAF domain-containing protein [Anaerolineae bacterium]|nr:GAF domain-containing protein [Anaerolineae bacterium]
MVKKDVQFVRFLQQECARVKDENEVLIEEVNALRRYVRALQDFQQTVQEFTPEQDVLALLDETMVYALDLLEAEDGSLMLVDEETDEMVFVLVHGTVRQMLEGYRFDRGLGVAGQVAESGEPAIINDVSGVSYFLPEVDERFGFVTQSLVAAPLIARGRVLGVLEVLNKRSDDGFTEDDASVLSVLATLAALALDFATSTASENKERRG